MFIVNITVYDIKGAFHCKIHRNRKGRRKVY